MSNDIILSGGSVPWLGINKVLNLVKDAGYDGLELLPTRKIVKEIKDLKKKYGGNRYKNISNLNLIKSIHQNWRLDNGFDKEYGISRSWSMFYSLIRFIFFPKVFESQKLIESLSSKLNIPVTVHDLSKIWIENIPNNEFKGGIQYEILGEKARKIEEIKKWLKNKNHSIVADTRDDQSILWAKNNGFSDWKEFWMWIGLKKIKNLQLTLIGLNGIKKIKNHKNSLAEEQLLWLHNNNWQGSVTVEVNPLIILILYQGDLKKGLEEILYFVEKTLNKGQIWSK